MVEFELISLRLLNYPAICSISEELALSHANAKPY